MKVLDDWVAIVDTKDNAKNILQSMKDFLWSELKLTTNKKTQILPLKNGVDFLGFHMYLTDTGKVIRKIRRDSKKAMKRKLKAFKVKYKEQELSKEDVKQSYDSWKGHTRHGNCNGLIREIDVLYKDIFKEREMLYDTSN